LQLQWFQWLCAQYSLTTKEARLSALAKLASLSLPAGTPEQMEQESVAMVEPLP